MGDDSEDNNDDMIRIMLTIKMLIIIMKMGQWMKMECKIMNRDKEEDE